jgi:hypothetical protein
MMKWKYGRTVFCIGPIHQLMLLNYGSLEEKNYDELFLFTKYDCRI